MLDRCAQPGASVGGVALAHGLHSNMVHRWIREQRERRTAVPPAFVSLPMPTAPYIPAALPARQAAPAEEPLLPEIDLQIQRGDLLVRLQCPAQGQPGGRTAAASLASCERPINTRAAVNGQHGIAAPLQLSNLVDRST